MARRRMIASRADMILRWLQGWDDLRDPKAGVIDWVAMKLSCGRELAKREIIDALRCIGPERIGVEVQRSDGVRRALALIERATTPATMDAKDEAAWRGVADQARDALAGKTAATPEPNLMKALDQIANLPSNSSSLKVPDSLPPAKVLAYLRQEEVRLVQRLRNQLTGAAEDVQAALGRVADVDDACYLSASPVTTLAEAYRLGGELHRIRQVLAMLKATAGFQ